MFQYHEGFVTCAVYRKVLPGLARQISCVSVDRFRENISGGLLVFTWCQSMVRIPSMVASLPPIERLIITGRYLQYPCRPPTPSAPQISSTMARELTLHTIAKQYDAALCANLRRKLRLCPDVVRPATHAADWDFHASEDLKAVLAATLVLLGNRLPSMPDVSVCICYHEPYVSSACHSPAA